MTDSELSAQFKERVDARLKAIEGRLAALERKDAFHYDDTFGTAENEWKPPE